MSYIYCITNLVNGKQYIGKTTYSVTKRFKEHCKEYKKERCEKRPLYCAMGKYGIQNFIVEQLLECPDDELSAYEIQYIEKYETYDSNGYNATKGGDGSILYDYKEIIKLYDLAIDDRDIFEIQQNNNSGIGISTKVILLSLDGDEEYDITDYDCW